jgi:hypothetical protein
VGEDYMLRAYFEKLAIGIEEIWHAFSRPWRMAVGVLNHLID